jgi:hypothetical protein
VLIFAALLADFLLGIFAALGLEQAHVPHDFASLHYLTFTFPYSHGLVALLLWGALAGLLLCRLDRRQPARAFFVIAALVISHFVLDALVHARELPLLGEHSPKVGLGLWNHMPLELTLETLLTFAGLAIYWQLAGSKLSRWGIAVFMGLLTGLTWTQLWMKQPPSSSQLVASWIIAPLVFAAVPFVLDRERVRTAQNG